ncbi:MAG: HupE/UreJ family protein [Terricaulis sp.]
MSKQLNIRMLSVIALGFVATLLLSAPAFAHGVPDAEVQRLISGGPLDFVRSGAIHMITGYDHLLFLFGVMFFLARFWSIVKFVTAFTVGHSITLLGATLLGVEVNYYLIDAVIAISVIYKGFDNLEGFPKWIGVKAPNLILMVFAFGLIHGMGLSARLQNIQLPPMSQTDLIERIVAFNVGVEAGQLAALVVMVAVLAVWRRFRSFPVFAKVANGGLMIAGSLLFLFQMHGWLHTQYPDSYGFSRDGHYHDHQAMQDELNRQREGRDTLMPAESLP